MNILLINNHTRHLQDLGASLTGHSLEVQMYQPGLEFNDAEKDLIILSGGGGEGLEIDDFVRRGKLWYQDEMDFVRRTTKPIIGICMGFEVIARAFGSEVPKMDELQMGPTHVTATNIGQKTFGLAKLKQFEAHQWHITEAPRGFEVLGESETGIEIIKKDNIVAAQFHPEKGGTMNLRQLLSVF